MCTLLRIDRLRVAYGATTVLRDVNLDVAEGDVVALVGPNGAGKSTLLRAVCGLATVQAGRILFRGTEIQGEKPHHVARRGIAYLPQEKNVFPSLTVDENLELGAVWRDGAAPDASGVEVALSIFPQLRALRRIAAGRLSGGQQQMVALARTLQGHPRLVLLDEPTRGLSDAMSEAVAQRIRESRQAGATVMLVEHNTAWAATVANRVVALEAGQFVAVVELSARGNTDEVRQKLSRY